MLHDCRGLPDRASGDATVEGALGYEKTAATNVGAAEFDPHGPLANACAALICVFMERREAPGMAAGYGARGDAASGTATPRVRLPGEARARAAALVR